MRPLLSPLLSPLLALLMLAACSRSTPPPIANTEPLPGPRPAVVAALDKGVNLSTWFTDRGAPDIDVKRFYPADSDFALMRRMGLQNVRIPVDPSSVQNGNGQLIAPVMQELKAGITAAQAAGLLVIVTLQPRGDIKHQLAESDAYVQALAQFWTQFAAQLSSFSPDTLVLEALNEPEIKDPVRSASVMAALVRGIRASLPEHTVAVSGHGFSNAAELLQMQPLADRNVIYAFHFYDPPNFTHQGAHWGWDMWAKFAGWPYPSSPEAVAPMLATAPPEVESHLRFYGQQRWNRAELGLKMDAAGAWAHRYKTVIWCSEFGVTRDAPPDDSRKAWLTDVRELLEARRIPWTVWDYSGHFGLVTGVQGARVADAGVITALGITAP